MNRLTQKSQEALHDAQTKALRFGHTEVDGEHLLLALLDQPDGLVPRLLRQAGADPDRLRRGGRGRARPPAPGQRPRRGTRPGLRHPAAVAGCSTPPSGRPSGSRTSTSRSSTCSSRCSTRARRPPPAGCCASRGSPGTASCRRSPRSGATSGSPRRCRRSPTRRWRSTAATWSPTPRAGRLDPVIGRDARDPPGHPDPVPQDEEQPGADRRPRRRQDRHRRGPRPADRPRRRPRGAARQDDLRARHGLAGGRREVPRRVRGAAQGRAERGEGGRGPDPAVRRRAAHRRRRRRGRGRDGRRQHAQADARPRRAAHDRRDHARRVPQAHREGRRAGAPLPAGAGRRAVRGGRHLDPARPARAAGGLPRREDPGQRAGRRGRAQPPLHLRPVPAGQGDRPGRRGVRDAAHRDRLDAGRARRAHPPGDPAGDRGGRAGQGDRPGQHGPAGGAAQGAGRPARRGRRHARPVGGRAAGAARVQELRQEIEQVRHEAEEAERDYDLNRAAELRHGRLPELERRLQAEEEQLAAKQGGKRLLREVVTEEEIAEIVVPVDRHPGQPAAGGRAGEAAAPRRDPARAGDRPGRGGAAGRRRDHPGPLRHQGPAPADRVVHLPRPDRRREDRAGQDARRGAVRHRGQHGPHRHERVPGAAHRQPAGRRAARATSATRRAASSPRRCGASRTRSCCSTRSRRRTPTCSTRCCRCSTTAGSPTRRAAPSTSATP